MQTTIEPFVLVFGLRYCSSPQNVMVMMMMTMMMMMMDDDDDGR
jgi:hypothetical protein